MSYILEALKRAERERAQGQNPVTGDTSTPTPPNRGRNTLLKIIIAALVVNALVIVVLVMRHKPDAKPEANAAAGKPPASARVRPPPMPEESAFASQPSAKAPPITAPAPPPTSAPKQEEPAVQQGVSSMDDLGAGDSDDADREGSTKIAQTPAVAAVEHRGSVTYAKKPLTREVPPPTQDENAGGDTEVLEQPEPPSQNETVEEQAPAPGSQVASAQPVAPRATPPTTASVTPPPAGPAAGKVKPLSDMSAAYQGTFPPLMLQVHVYDPQPQKRFAIIDGTRYREGDSLPQGARLEQIVADGLVIDFRNERVLYPLGRH